MVTKMCYRCRSAKLLEYFSRNRSKKDGRATFCKKCMNEISRKRYSPEKDRKRKLVRLYNLTIEQYDLILWNQGGVCSICKNPPKEGKKLQVDHNHTTGSVRGLLCSRCNWLVGALEDDSADAAIDYIKRYGK